MAKRKNIRPSKYTNTKTSYAFFFVVINFIVLGQKFRILKSEILSAIWNWMPIQESQQRENKYLAISKKLLKVTWFPIWKDCCKTGWVAFIWREASFIFFIFILRRNISIDFSFIMTQSIWMVYWNYINFGDLKLAKKCNFIPNAVYSKCIYHSEQCSRYLVARKRRACHEFEVQKRQTLAETLPGLVFEEQANIHKSCKN